MSLSDIICAYLHGSNVLIVRRQVYMYVFSLEPFVSSFVDSTSRCIVHTTFTLLCGPMDTRLYLNRSQLQGTFHMTQASGTS